MDKHNIFDSNKCESQHSGQAIDYQLKSVTQRNTWRNTQNNNWPNETIVTLMGQNYVQTLY